MNTQEFRSQAAIFAANNNPEVVLKTLAQVLGTIAAHIPAEFAISDKKHGWTVTVELDDSCESENGGDL